MKNKLYALILVILIIFAAGCEAENVTKDPIVIPEPVIEQVKDTLPIDERKFVYNNALKIEHKDSNAVDKDNIKIISNYPVITGLNNKTVQDNINNEIEDVVNAFLSQFESEFLTLMKDEIVKVNNKSSSAYIAYSYNNVIFVEYSVYIEAVYKGPSYYPSNKYKFCGYDLNTGERIKLSDVFKPGSDYTSKINSFISQFIIKNNYDDYEAERMTKPFQGIKDDQNFTLGFEGLRIVLDEKNDEFFNDGYSDQILIPFSYFDDDLYIFDKYFDESDNIFEQDKLSKKLLPNRLEFKLKEIIQEDNPRYLIYINDGEFINVPDKAIERKLNELVVSKANVEAFKEKAINNTDKKAFANLGHFVNVFTNAGGYLSVGIFTQSNYGGRHEFNRITFNYDFNKNKEILLSELFAEEVEIEAVMRNYIRKMQYSVTEEMIETGVKEALKSRYYYFDEYGVCIKFSPAGAKLDPYEEWIYVPFDAFGYENVSLFN